MGGDCKGMRIANGEEASKRWRNIKDYFNKKRKKAPPTGSELDDEPEYIYAAEMNFLVPHEAPRSMSRSSLEIAKQSGSKSAPEKDEIDEIMASCGYGSDDDIIVDDGAGQLPLNTTPGTSKSGNKRKRRRLPPDVRNDDDELQLLKKEEKYDDSAARFGKDVAEFLRTLSKKKELEFKMKIQQMMMEYMEEKEN